MKKQPLISVIVPTFNTEKYIKKCITSIIKQKYKNIEIIIIESSYIRFEFLKTMLNEKKYIFVVLGYGETDP